MMNIMMILFILVLISIILLIINAYISKKSVMSQEKMFPFECGFNPSSGARLPFSSQFFMINLIFLIFNFRYWNCITSLTNHTFLKF